MSKEKQIEEMASCMCGMASGCSGCIFNRETCYEYKDAEDIYNAGYRKQSEGEWVDNHCTKCGMTPIGDETWTDHGLTPPRFELFMSFCPNCGARMGGGAE